MGEERKGKGREGKGRGNRGGKGKGEVLTEYLFEAVVKTQIFL